MSPRALSQDDIRSFREEICSCATRLFAEKGVEGVTLRALSAELGCSPMTPYRYFESKDEIFHEVRERAFIRFGDRAASVIEGIEDPVERFRVLSRSYVAFALEEPDAYRVMFQLDQSLLQLALGDGEEGSKVRRCWDVLHGILAECVRTGRMHGDPETLAHVAWFSVHGAVTLQLAHKLSMGKSLDELIEPLIDQFLNGCLRRPDTDTTETDRTKMRPHEVPS